MKIQRNKVDHKNNSGSMEIVAEHQDDIYVLGMVISMGDMVTSSTTRKIQIDAKTQQRISLTLKIKIETVSVDLGSSTIYLKGKTVVMHEHVKLGSYHTIDIVPGHAFELEKQEWPCQSIKLLKEATKPQPEMIFIIFYEKECVVSVVSKARVSILMKQEIKNKKFCNIIKTLEKHVSMIDLFVVASAFEVRNEFYKAVSFAKELSKVLKSFCVVKVPAECKGYSNLKVINTILTNKELSKTFQGIQYVEDLKQAENFFVAFAKGSELVCIGMEDIREAMDYGALERVVIIDEKVKPNNIEERIKAEMFCKELGAINCKISIIPAAHFCGEKLKEMGGVCAMLKFNYK
ncbi:PelA-like RNA-binding protein [Ordospora colligata]|nr:PelA-like RNA-binding protein [Ordospora colligata]TBU16618.1 PelA-like RNA-binding protein [Ordospora colligata]TBU19191.1 PelA-like RNA-binding protein [Ordospora colligata]